MIFLARGLGRHREKLSSFEMALRNCGIAQFNLVRVSSIYPPNCKLVKPEKGLAELKAGQVVHVVMAEAATNEPQRLIAASVGVAIPKDVNQFGYLSEHHGYGQRPVITRKTWPQRCWPPCSALSLTRTRVGTRSGRFGASAGSSYGPPVSRKQPWVTKTGAGLRSFPLRYWYLRRGTRFASRIGLQRDSAFGTPGSACTPSNGETLQ